VPGPNGLLNNVVGPNGLLDNVVGPNGLLDDVVMTFPCFERWVGGCRKSGGNVCAFPTFRVILERLSVYYISPWLPRQVTFESNGGSNLTDRVCPELHSSELIRVEMIRLLGSVMCESRRAAGPGPG
jgi:hypothetical protein